MCGGDQPSIGSITCIRNPCLERAEKPPHQQQQTLHAAFPPSLKILKIRAFRGASILTPTRSAKCGALIRVPIISRAVDNARGSGHGRSICTRSRSATSEGVIEWRNAYAGAVRKAASRLKKCPANAPMSVVHDWSQLTAFSPYSCPRLYFVQ